MSLLAPTGWFRVIALTVVGTVFCIGVALFVDSFNFARMTPAEREWAIWQNILVATALAGPIIFLLSFQMRRLTLIQEELRHAATVDGLTELLNRGAFKMLVGAYLESAPQRAEERTGALLVIDADHFKAVNDNWGHDSGDEALRLIAGSIRTTLGAGDLAARLGGEEFGVFLPGAVSGQSIGIAERIRAAVSAIEFAPKGVRWPLSVSIGGVTFSGDARSFDTLYQSADECLFEAKRAGRDRVQWRRAGEKPRGTHHAGAETLPPAAAAS
ncbi:MAG: GGDEF domain-containing protein [Mesorhizobium amorphae]|nr:MAG: GGDEF domain-containing protein [Mesorhizobium amorphae]